MKTFKRTISTILAVLMIASVLTTGAVVSANSETVAESVIRTEEASAETKEIVAPELSTVNRNSEAVEFDKATATYSGKCGDNLIWTLDTATCVLNISGTGDMYDYVYSGSPWGNYRAYIKEVVIGDSVTSIGGYAFMGCSALTDITIPRSITSIGGGAFYECSSLMSVNISDLDSWCRIEFKSEHHYTSPLAHGAQLYLNGEVVTDVAFPKDIESISGLVFFNCKTLRKVTIPDSVAFIGYGAFSKCSALEKINVPDSVRYIGGDAFYNTAYYKNSDNWDGDVLYIGNHLIDAKDDIVGEFIVKDGTITIASGVFKPGSYSDSWSSEYNTGLTNVIIPDSVVSIGDSAFYGCRALANISLSKNVETIGNRAFYECVSLAEVSLGNSLKTIRKYAFYGCPITKIYIPYSVTEIEGDAFANKTIILCHYGSYAASYAANNGYPIEYVTISVSVNNYTISIENAEEIKDIRYALGTYSTPAQVKAAPGNYGISTYRIEANTVDGVFSYDLPTGGSYTIWIRMKDGREFIQPLNLTTFTPTVSTYGVKITVDNLYGAKDFFIAKGEFANYNEIKENGYIVRVTDSKIAGKRSYTYTVSEPGMHTVLVRYNDGSEYIFHEDLTVDEPVFTVNGLQVTVSNIPDVKVIRTAYGEYYTPGDTKRAEGARNFSNKAVIKDAEEYMLQYREEGRVTIIVEYNNGYVKVFHYDVVQKTPTVKQNGNTVTFADLDGLVMVRYAAGEYATSSEIKKASGSKVIKSDSIIDGKITVNDLAEGTYTFCVQYDDESYNYYTVTVG